MVTPGEDILATRCLHLGNYFFWFLLLHSLQIPISLVVMPFKIGLLKKTDPIYLSTDCTWLMKNTTLSPWLQKSNSPSTFTSDICWLNWHNVATPCRIALVLRWSVSSLTNRVALKIKSRKLYLGAFPDRSSWANVPISSTSFHWKPINVN